jgi:uncharacterized membrane protein
VSGPRSSVVNHGQRRTGVWRAALIAGMVGAAVLLLPTTGSAASPPTATTPYPSVTVSPGTKVSFDLTVTAGRRETVKLATERLPTDWTATLRGGGYEVTAVAAGPGSSAGKVTLEVDVPATATAGRFPIAVRASGSDGSTTLDLEIQVNAAAGGQVQMTSDFPSLSGASSTTFTFNLTLSNETPEDRTFAVSASGPAGWQVQARPSGEAQAASLPVKAGATATLSVTADPPDTVPAGQYPITVKATQGGQEVDAQLSVEIIGQFALSLSPPDQRLNAQGTAGSPIDFQLQVQNTGTAPLQAIKLTATPPSGWKVDFSPAATIDAIDPGTSQTVTAKITPSDQAIAGDYVVSFSAAASEATTSQDIRVTVETSLTWAIVGIALIVLVFVGLGWVFQRFGRR